MLAFPVTLFAAGPWHVAQADVRFELEITSSPSEPCAGIVATVPDGGLLPRGSVEALVFDEAGNELKSGCLGHDPQSHYRLVFAAPSAGKHVYAYFRAGIMRPVGPEFCPGLLLLVNGGTPTLEAARKLTGSARGGLVDAIASLMNPFGPQDVYCSAHVGYLNIAKAGRYYLATVSDDGSEVRVDGKLVCAWPGGHGRGEGAKGKFGDWIELTEGRHRVEYFHFQGGGGQEMHLVWRTPNMAADSLPVTVPASAYVHSGVAQPIAATLRDGEPAAFFEYGAESYLWLGEQPVNLFQFRAKAAGTWEFGPGLRVQGDRLRWLLEGDGPHPVTFRAGKSQCTLPVAFGIPPGRSTADNQNQRRTYADVLLARCRAVQSPARPCADWTPSLWATLLGVAVPGEARELLDEVFNRSRQDVLALKTEDRWTLEDRYFDLLRATNPAGALKWLDQFIRDERDNKRRFAWQIAQVELYLYELDDADKARTLSGKLTALANGAGAEATARLLVRQGDIERLAGQVDKAREIYAAAQKSGRDWRAAAVRQASYYEEVRNALQQGSLDTARDRLAAWEIELPMSKLEGDYILAEAQYLIAVERQNRALRNLLAFRQQTDLSPFLPDAMKLERDCLISLKRYDELAALAADLEKRFPTLPLTRETTDLAKRYGGKR